MSTASDTTFKVTGTTAEVGTLKAANVEANSMSAWLPSVDSSGNLSWSVGSTTSTTPETKNIMGPAGAQFNWDSSTGILSITIPS